MYTIILLRTTLRGNAKAMNTLELFIILFEGSREGMPRVAGEIGDDSALRRLNVLHPELFRVVCGNYCSGVSVAG